jgi:hypothetical protein
MAFNKAYLTRVGGSATQQLFTYYSTDGASTIVASAYFNDVIADMNLGDIILCVYLGAGANATMELVVSSVTTNVTTTNNVTQS